MHSFLHFSSKMAATIMLLMILAPSAQVLAQNYENFDNLTLGSTPGDGSFVGVSVPWNYYNCRGDVEITGKAITLGVGGTTSSLTCYYMPQDIQTISFDLMQVGPNPATVFIRVNDNPAGSRTTSVQGLVVNSGPISLSIVGGGAVKVEFITTEGGNEVTLDNIYWTVTPDNIETFDGLMATEDFEDGDFTGENDHFWEYYQGREGYMDGLAIELGDFGSLFCEDISAGMFSLNFDYIQTTSEAVELDIYINDEYLTTVSSNSYSARINTGEIIVDNAGGEFNEYLKIEIRNVTYGYVMIDNVAWTDRPYSFTEFTGTGNWSDPSRWDNGIPNRNYYAFIRGHATIDEEATAHYVGVDPQWTLTILDPEILIAPTLTIRADATGYGSLIAEFWSLDHINNTNMEWHISSGVPEAWHLLSSPVQGQGLTGNSNQFTPSGSYPDGTGYDFYAWHEPTEMWLNRKVSGNSINSFTRGKGYLVAYEDISTDKFFSSFRFNSGTISIPVTAPGMAGKSSNGIYAGYNLIGNPYPSSIDWKDRTNLDKGALNYDNNGYTMYIWNDAVNNYGAYNDATTGDNGTNGVSRYIPPLQGFFVLAQSNADFVFNDGARVHSSQQYMKSGNEQGFRLSVTAPESAGKDEILLDFGHEANHGGADKWYSMSDNAPSLYLPVYDKNFSIRFLNSVEENSLIPVSFKAGIAGEYRISANFNTAAYTSVKLKDLLSGNIHDLSTNPEYTFTAATNDHANRFALVFGTLGVNDPDAENEVQVYAHAGTLYLNRQTAIPATIKVYNLTGQLVMEGKAGDNTLTTLNAAHLSSGIYLVNVVTDERLVSRKVAITK